MSDNRYVTVTYSDGGTRYYTVDRLRRLRKGSDEVQNYNFFYDLLNYGRVKTALATYELMRADWKPTDKQRKKR